jgi:hypothetical protein
VTSRRELRHVSLALGCLIAVFIIELSLSNAGLRLDIPALQQMVRTWV